jgi:hypothetical protein
MESAIKREKQLKKWNRKWKLELIETMNPTWCDLHNEITFADHHAEKPPLTKIFSK